MLNRNAMGAWRMAGLALAATFAVNAVGVAAHAEDRRDDHRGDARGGHRDVHGHPGGYAPPPVVYGGGPSYPPPPIVYAGPGITINIP